MANPQVVIELVSTGRQQVQAEINALRQAAGPAGTSQRALQRETAAAARSSAQQARELAAASRGLLTLRSTLGGVERAQAQTTVAQNRLSAAVRAGLVDQREAARLTGLITQRFSVQSVQAADLRRNMTLLNTNVLALV